MGDPTADHNDWQNLEKTDTPRTLYKIYKPNPGIEIEAETTTALDASSIAFVDIDNPYSNRLLKISISV